MNGLGKGPILVGQVAYCTGPEAVN
jgi:hypothetical protein